VIEEESDEGLGEANRLMILGRRYQSSFLPFSKSLRCCDPNLPDGIIPEYFHSHRCYYASHMKCRRPLKASALLPGDSSSRGIGRFPVNEFLVLGLGSARYFSGIVLRQGCRMGDAFVARSV
jgi:hypothetical protein